jgi:hypothetical protein
MRFTHSLLLFLVTLFSLAPGAARAADVAFFPVETPNLAPVDGSAIGELLAQAYASTSRKAVLSPSHTEGALQGSTSHVEAARMLGVSEYVRTSAVGVGRKIVIQATRHQADGGQLAHAKMTADSIEDVTSVSERMATALFQQVDDETVRTYKNVTLTEGRARNKVWTEKVTGVKTGVHMPFAPDAKYSPHVSVAFNGRLEHERFFLEFGAGALIPTDGGDSYDCDYDSDTGCSSRSRNRGHVGGLTAEIGASYFLTQGNTGLYVGGGFLPRLTFANNDIASASVYGQLGVMLPREASTRFYADLRMAQAIIETHLDNGKSRYPTELALHVGIGW